MIGPNPTGFCMCGCGERTALARDTDERKGWMKGQPKRFVNGHNSRTRTFYTVEDRGYDTPCWIWQTRWRDRDGYGMTERGGRSQVAHRYFYQLHRGSIPEGLQLDHLCSIRACVNPDHLEPVTPRENARRSRATKLTVSDVQEIRQSAEPAVSIALRLGVSASHVRNVRAMRRQTGWNGAT